MINESYFTSPMIRQVDLCCKGGLRQILTCFSLAKSVLQSSINFLSCNLTNNNFHKLNRISRFITHISIF